ncbi:hypothetical protein Droror1_Dr00026386 [Drosera rotundifolia]
MAISSSNILKKLISAVIVGYLVLLLASNQAEANSPFCSLFGVPPKSCSEMLSLEATSASRDQCISKLKQMEIAEKFFKFLVKLDCSCWDAETHNSTSKYSVGQINDLFKLANVKPSYTIGVTDCSKLT